MPDAPRSIRPLLPLWAAVLVSIAGGLGLTLAFAPIGWWPLAFVAVAVSLTAVIGRSIGGAVLVGLAFGAAFYLVNVSFTARYLGVVPWLALSILEALLTAVAVIPMALAYRWLPRVAPAPWARLTLLPALVAALWTMREDFLGSWPYGGFPWGRVGISQTNGPIADIASWVGVSGLSFLVVFAAAAGVEYVRLGRWRDLRAPIPTAAALAVLLLLPQFPTTPAGSIRVGAVQGNGPTGYFDPRSRNEVLQAQLDATAPLIGERMDVLLWPEGGIDSDPTNNAGTASVLNALSERVGAPLVVNAATQRGERAFNTSMLWDAGADNPVQTYDKWNPVPFGEYVPDRWFWGMLAPDLINLIQREYTRGIDPPVFDVGGVRTGLAICFDVIYDDVTWTAARDGAEVYMYQTNNADFRGTSENLQQLEFARMRAIETGRAVVNISTVGTSQVIASDGSVLDVIGADTAGAMLTDVPLRTGLTPASVIGPWVKGVLGWGSLAAVIALGATLALRRRYAKTPAPAGTGVEREG